MEAAGAVFAERGYEGTAISEIYNRVGMTKGAFYFHFAGKLELAQAVLASQVDEESGPIVPRERKLQEMCDAGLVFAYQLARDPMLQGSIRLSLEPGIPGLDPQLPFRSWIEFNRAALTAAHDNDELLPDLDLPAIAEMFVGCFSGLQLLSQAMDGRQKLEERVAFWLSQVLTSIARPEIRGEIDLSPGRAAAVLAEAQALHGSAS